MGAFDRARDFLMGEVFARLVVLFLFAWLVIVWTAWQHAEQRANRAESQLHHITTACKQYEDGSAECPDRTFRVLTTTTTEP